MPTKNELKALLASGNFKEALQILQKIAEERGDNSFQNSVIHQASRFAQAQQENRDGVISNDNLKLELAKVNRALLDLIDQLPGAPSAAAATPVLPSENIPAPPPNNPPFSTGTGDGSPPRTRTGDGRVYQTGTGDGGTTNKIPLWIGGISGLAMLALVALLLGNWLCNREPISTMPTTPLGQDTTAFSDPFANNMVRISGGSFSMGCDSTRDGNCSSNNEKPLHDVTIRDFSLSRYEVTQAQWRAVMGKDPKELYFTGCDDCPVENVSWDDVHAFIKKLNQLTGKNYRLPSEAEWEFAARGGNNSNNTKYAGSDNLDEVAWYGSNSGKETHPVGKKKKNELGLYDMSGNVWEWCQDVYHDSYEGAPGNGSAWTSGGKQSIRAVRGGSWSDNTVNCRSALRLGALLTTGTTTLASGWPGKLTLCRFYPFTLCFLGF